MMYRKRRKIRRAIAAVVVTMLLMVVAFTYDGSYECSILNTMAHASLKDVRLPDVKVFGYKLSDIRFPDISFDRLMRMLHKPVAAMADLSNAKDKSHDVDVRKEGQKDNGEQAGTLSARLKDINIEKEDVKNTASVVATGYFNFFLDLIDNKYNNTEVLGRFVEYYSKKDQVVESEENAQSDTEGT